MFFPRTQKCIRCSTYNFSSTHFYTFIFILDMKPSVSSEAAMRSSPSSSIGQANPHIPPGMLSAALMGSFNNILATPPTTSSHPPTPPRTPKAPTSIAAAMAAAAGGGGEPTNNSRLSDVKPPLAHQPTGQQPPPMPPLLSLAAIQEQVKAPNNILAAQLNKPMMMPCKSIYSAWPRKNNN